MTRGKRRWIMITLPTKRAIEKFKKEIKPFIMLVAMAMDEWEKYDYKKIKIRRVSDNPVPSTKLRNAKKYAEKKEKGSHKLKKDLEIVRIGNQKLKKDLEIVREENQRLKKVVKDAEKEIHLAKWGKLKMPEHFKIILKKKIGKDYPAVRVIHDIKHKYYFIDVGKTRMTLANWKEFIDKVIPVVNKPLKGLIE